MNAARNIASASHTAGPWRLAEGHERSGSDQHYVWADAKPGDLMPPDMRAICSVHADPKSGRNVDANARLIVAAPELLEALKGFTKQWEACGPNSDFGRYFLSVYKTSCAAIAKAEGRS